MVCIFFLYLNLHQETPRKQSAWKLVLFLYTEIARILFLFGFLLCFVLDSEADMACREAAVPTVKNTSPKSGKTQV